VAADKVFNAAAGFVPGDIGAYGTDRSAGGIVGAGRQPGFYLFKFRMSQRQRYPSACLSSRT
jgi:hypothetical protein